MVSNGAAQAPAFFVLSNPLELLESLVSLAATFPVAFEVPAANKMKRLLEATQEFEVVSKVYPVAHDQSHEAVDGIGPRLSHIYPVNTPVVPFTPTGALHTTPADEGFGPLLALVVQVYVAPV